MRVFLLIPLYFLITGCQPASRSKKNIDTVYTDSAGNRFDLSPIKTPMGRTIDFKIVGDRQVLLRWTVNKKSYVLSDTLYLNSDPSVPRFIDENANYIVLRSSCGNPCWIGYFLPLYDRGKSYLIHEYLAFNLKEELVVNVWGQDTILMQHLKTAKKQIFQLDSCSSVFPAYCIDSIYINQRTLHYRRNEISKDSRNWITARISI